MLLKGARVIIPAVGVLFALLLLLEIVFAQNRPAVPQVMTVSSGSSKFAAELLFAAAQEKGVSQNLALSPLSIWSVLALVQEGANGKTRQQLQTALHLKETNKENRLAFRDIREAIKINTPSIEATSASALFVDQEHHVRWEFEYLADKVYQSTIHQLHFAQAQEAVKTINAWVANATRNRITSIVSLEHMTNIHLAIVSCSFFKGLWDIPFNKSETYRDNFLDDNGNKVAEVAMMYQQSHFLYTVMSELKAKVLELPYAGGKFSMLVILPLGKYTLNMVLERLRDVTLEQIYTQMENEDNEYPDTTVEVMLPRFTIETESELHRPLEKLGILDIFHDAKADLTGISPHIYLNKLIHKAEIEVTEEGTTASGSTVSVYSHKQASPQVKANRPFAYFLIEKTTKLIVFAGTVYNPNT